MKNDVKDPLLKSVLLVLIGSCLFLLSCKTSPVGDHPSPDGKPWDGKRWFGMQHCDGCHGKDGAGGQAPEIHLEKLNYPELLGKLRKSQSIVMPSYPDKYLSDQRVADICSYLQNEKRWASAVEDSQSIANRVELP